MSENQRSPHIFTASISKSDRRNAFAAFGIIFYMLAIADIVSGPAVIDTGRWAWLYSIINEELDMYGMTYVKFGIGSILFLFSLLNCNLFRAKEDKNLGRVQIL